MQRVFVTGGTRGIGKGIVESFVKDGAKVAFTYHSNTDAAEALENQFNGNGGHVKGFCMDSSDAASAKKVVKMAKAFLDKRIDVLVNNAGIKRDKSLMLMKEDEWDVVLNTNLKGCFNMTKLFLVDFLKQKKGHIVNITSVSGIKGIAGQTNYSASKAGMIGFTRSLAREVMPYGVTVNAIAPGFIDTEMVQEMGEKEVASVINEIPAGRLGAVEEIADLVKFVASERARYITGQVIVADGGLST